jgi:uncharacterized membrane protein YtjA (UPF0391 family)
MDRPIAKTHGLLVNPLVAPRIDPHRHGRSCVLRGLLSTLSAAFKSMRHRNTLRRLPHEQRRHPRCTDAAAEELTRSSWGFLSCVDVETAGGGEIPGKSGSDMSDSNAGTAPITLRGRAREHWLQNATAKACASGETKMLHYAVVFFIIAIVAAILGFGGIAAGAAGIAKVLFFVFLILAVLTFLRRA